MKTIIKNNQYLGGIIFTFALLTCSIPNFSYGYDEVPGYDFDKILDDIETVDILEEMNWQKYRTSTREISKNILEDIEELNENIEQIQYRIDRGDYPPSYKRKLINWKYEYEIRLLKKEKEHRKYSR